MVDSSFHRNTWDLEYNRASGIGGEVFGAIEGSDISIIAEYLGEQGINAPYDSLTINVFVWSQGEDSLTFPFSQYTHFVPQLQQVEMTDTARAQIMEHLQTDLPIFTRNRYQINIFEGDYQDLPIRAVVTTFGDTVAIEKKSWQIIYTGNNNSHGENVNNDEGRTYSANATLKQGFDGTLNPPTLKRETYQSYGPRRDIDDPSHPSANFSFFNVFGSFFNYTEYDLKAMDILLKFGRKFRFFNP